MIKAAYVTTARSDYGPSFQVIKRLFSDKRFDTTLLVGGAHWSRRSGETFREIEEHQWPSIVKLPFPLEGTGARLTARGMSRALYVFSEYFFGARPDVVVLYGDRIELLPIASAAVLNCIPIAHIGGGEITQGAFDEQVRHAITKLSHVHFVATKLSATRLYQMGEETWRVHTVGDPAIDNVLKGSFSGVAELKKLLGFRPSQSTILVTFHPVTLELAEVEHQAGELVKALHDYQGEIVVTSPAPDPGAAVVRRSIRKLLSHGRKVVLVDNLGSRRYRGLLRQVGAIVGNSSSGLIEASAIPVATVNIGSRQAGRERGANVIDVKPEHRAIAKGINRALSYEFRNSIQKVGSLYGTGEASKRIISILAKLPDRKRLLTKHFIDVSNDC